MKLSFFECRPCIQDYLSNIQACDLIAIGDSLTLHLGLTLKKKIVAIFTCTSPDEIYDYGRMIKIVSPKLEEAYKMECCYSAVEAISLERVFSAC